MTARRSDQMFFGMEIRPGIYQMGFRFKIQAGIFCSRFGAETLISSL